MRSVGLPLRRERRLLVALAVPNLWNYAVTDSWSAWYGQSAVSALVILSAITLYGVWAATRPGGLPSEPGRSPQGALS